MVDVDTGGGGMAGIKVFVHGTPSTQGSLRPYVRGVRAVVVDDNREKLRPWREAVRSTLVDALPVGWVPLAGPVVVVVHFRLRRPVSAPKRRKTWPIGRRSGDLDKLARAVLDAGTDAGVWVDDAQVVSLSATKDYATNFVGAVIEISPGG